jgi:ABC-2 type transport system ATP-binding protein
VIELRAVTKRFGSRRAVDALTLHVPPGEIFGLLGHNGAGKSTAIGLMLGQVWPTAGDVLIRGFHIMRERRLALAKVGALFETPAFYDYLSGYRNLEILTTFTAPTPRRRILEVVDWVGLTGRERSPVRTYSHGMRARLALAQALLPEPELLILDEPGDGLDPEGLHELRQTILRLHRELGLTILLSSHLLNEVQQLCSRIAVLRQGRKVFEGPIAEARRSACWFRLGTRDFPAAAAALQAAGLIASSASERLIELAAGTSPDAIVRCLVALGLPVFEIARYEQTLEEFYLALMRNTAPAAEAPPAPAAVAAPTPLPGP